MLVVIMLRLLNKDRRIWTGYHVQVVRHVRVAALYSERKVVREEGVLKAVCLLPTFRFPFA